MESKLYFDDDGVVRGDAIVLREVGEENDRTPSLHMKARIKERENACLKTIVIILSPENGNEGKPRTLLIVS